MARQGFRWLVVALTFQGLAACAAGGASRPASGVAAVIPRVQRKACDEYGVVKAQLHDVRFGDDVVGGVGAVLAAGAYNPAILVAAPVVAPLVAPVAAGFEATEHWKRFRVERARCLEAPDEALSALVTAELPRLAAAYVYVGKPGEAARLYRLGLVLHAELGLAPEAAQPLVDGYALLQRQFPRELEWNPGGSPGSAWGWSDRMKP